MIVLCIVIRWCLTILRIRTAAAINLQTALLTTWSDSPSLVELATSPVSSASLATVAGSFIWYRYMKPDLLIRRRVVVVMLGLDSIAPASDTQKTVFIK